MGLPSRASWLCAACALIAAAGARAQVLSLSKDGASGADPLQHVRGEYTGVKPGGDEAPAIPAKAGKTPPSITWPGFQMRPDGSSRVFVQMTAATDVSAALVGGKVLVDFGDASIAGATNRLPLYTSFFNTPVTRMELRRANKRTVLELSMRAPLEPRISTEHAKSGFYFVYLDFPAGDYLPKGGPAPIGPAAGPPALPLTEREDAALQEAPAHLDGELGASGDVEAAASADVSADAELPPGMAAPKARGRAKASGEVKGEAKFGF